MQVQGRIGRLTLEKMNVPSPKIGHYSSILPSVYDGGCGGGKWERKKHKVTLPSSLGRVNDPAKSDTSSLMHTTTIETIPSSQVKGEPGVTVCESETAPFRVLTCRRMQDVH